jgi:2,4-dienoyl-CoA reductase-like NADH-dependent reductase (Old Yellow Enzyme family)
MTGLFSTFRLRSVTLKNRIAVSPMCLYRATEGFVNDWHLVHLGARAIGGAAMVVAEATAVAPEGRITPACAGLWSDAHADAWAPIVQFLKRQGAVPGIQLAHAGRKANVNRPWEGDDHIPEDDRRSWRIVGPSPLAWGALVHRVPHELNVADIRRVQDDFVAAAIRARDIGFECLMLHFAHGYLGQSFLSPIANHRTDAYGGSFENRARFLLEVTERVRAVWPDHLPLTAKLGIGDFVPESHTVEESIELTRRLKARGVDLLDLSVGFNTSTPGNLAWGPGMLVPFAARFRSEADIPTSVGWFITEPHQADEVVRRGQADVITLARPMLDDPHWPFHAAKALGREDPEGVLPETYASWLRPAKVSPAYDRAADAEAASANRT